MIFFSQLTGIDPEVSRFRDLVKRSRSSSSVAEEFLSQTEKINNDSPALMLGFKAMSHLLFCDHTANVYSKYSYFNKGKNLLETALEREPANIELIFFRFTTQCNAPGFLAYRNKLTSDKLKLITYLERYDKKVNPDSELFAMIKTYLLLTKECNETEKEKVKKL